MKKLKFIALFISLLILPIMVNATAGTVNVSLSCPTTAAASATVSCTISAQAEDLASISVKYDFTNATYVSFTLASGWTNQGNASTGFLATRLSGISTKVTLGTLKVKMPSSGSAKVGFKDVTAGNSNDEDYRFKTLNSQTIRVKSTDNTLSSLTVSGASFTFDKNTTTYNLTVDAASTTISATATDSYAKISGTGSKTLKYGKNTFSVVVTAESGAKKTYTLNITRPDNRSSDNTLATLKLSKGTLTFNKNTTTYNVNVDSDVTKIKVDATLSDAKASFVKNYGPREVSLNYGVNKIQVKVKAENESERVYTINVTRKDDRSSNAYLKSISISSGEIAFNKQQTKYQIVVENDVEKFVVKPVAEDSKSKVSYTEMNTLKVGTNTIKIKVTAENNATKTYELTVTRKEQGQVLDSNNYLKSLDIEGYTIAFSKDVSSYELTINEETKLNITALAEGQKAIVNIIGNEDLKNGSIITISVTAEDGTKKDYTIKVNKKEAPATQNIQPTTNNTTNKQDSDDKLPLYIGIGIAVLLLLIIIIVVSKKKNKQE